MLPGTTYTTESLVQIALRRKWWIALPLFLGTAIAVGVGRELPDRYRSETVIMLVPQRIPDSYVRSTVTAALQDRLATLNAQILSRSRLERIISDLNLYPAERRLLPMEDVVQRMRDDIEPIKLEGVQSSFRLAYVGQEPKTVQKVTERLASLFIEENNRDRETVAAGANEFLDERLADAKRQLLAQEKKLEQYREIHSGELPSQATSNLQVIQNAQMQLQALNEADDRDRERRLLVERQLADIDSPDLEPQPGGPETTEQQLDNARLQLSALQMRLKPEHPDIRIQQRTIRDLEAKLEAENRREAAGQPIPKGPQKRTLSEAVRQRRIKDLKTQLDDIDRQLREKHDQSKKLQTVMAQYQAKLEALPKRESELVELTRDYNTLHSTYQSLLEKREDSKLTVSLEKKSISENFRVLDPAKEPERPVSPNRPLIDALGALAGLAVGIGFVALLEYRDSSFRNEADVVRVLQLPVLALVPALRADVGRKLLK